MDLMIWRGRSPARWTASVEGQDRVARTRVARRASAVAVLAAGSVGLALLACDLFHSTNFVTLCELDASAEGCGDGAPRGDAGAVTPTDFCTLDAGGAYQFAQHACAWLSACESPLG